jgi:hypothetical protein
MVSELGAISVLGEKKQLLHIFTPRIGKALLS